MRTPAMLVRGLLAQGAWADVSPGTRVPVQLYWHCWNLESALLDRLTAALTTAAQAKLSAA